MLPRETYDMVHYGRIVPRTAVQPGDLVFSNPDPRGPGHVAMVVNPTTIVEAQTFGVPVKLSTGVGMGSPIRITRRRAEHRG